jgi:Arc/MetJ-type ribon-helix-helix transcriptional regulator
MAKARAQSKTIGTKITRVMYNKILERLEEDTHLSVSDYLRDLIRKDIEEKG